LNILSRRDSSTARSVGLLRRMCARTGKQTEQRSRFANKFFSARKRERGGLKSEPMMSRPASAAADAPPLKREIDGNKRPRRCIDLEASVFSFTVTSCRFGANRRRREERRPDRRPDEVARYGRQWENGAPRTEDVIARSLRPYCSSDVGRKTINNHRF